MVISPLPSHPPGKLWTSATDQSPDLLVSSELLEETSALRLAAQLRCQVMVLTARSGSEPVVSLLDGGADDVLRKPFGLEELAARCRTLLRRSATGLQERVCVGPLEVHLLLRQVMLRDQPVELSPREFALLCALLMPPGSSAAARNCCAWPGLPSVAVRGRWILRSSPCAANWSRPALAKAVASRRCGNRDIDSASTPFPKWRLPPTCASTSSGSALVTPSTSTRSN
jgi:CheY-like chemotaxis protein